MNKLIKEAMDSLALVGIYSKDASPEEVAKKREIERLTAFIKKYPTGSNNRLVANAIEEAKVKLAELINGKKISQDNDATENGAIKQFGQSKETEVMPLEKKPVLAQDSQNLKKMAYFRLLVSGDIINTPDGKVEIEKYDNVGFLGRNGKRYKWDDVAVYNNDEDKFGTVMKEFYEGKLKSGSGKTVTDPQQAKAIAYSESKDEEPVYTFGGQFKKLDESEKEKLEVEGKLQELYDIRDGLLSGAKNTNSSKFNPIKQNIQNHENKLKEIENDIKRIKSGGKMTKDDFYTGEDDTMTTKEAREYWNKYHNTDPVLELYKTFEEWYRESKLNGYIKDAYDPKKYEGSHRHETNIWRLGNEVTTWRSRYENAKDRINALNRMVSSGQYGKMTNQELKEANRDLETARMKLEQSLSMLQRAKGQKDEAPTVLDECMEVLRLSGFATDAEPTWQDVYQYFNNASLQELEKLDSRDKVISFLRQKGAYGKYPKDKIDEAIRRFMDS